MATLRFFLQFLLLLLLNPLQCANGSASANLPAATTASVVASSEGGSNPLFQLVGYVKDACVRTIDGCGMMYKNHQRCNGIRGKQKEHREAIQKKWEMEGRMTKEEVKTRLKSVNGGISYGEYAFLVKGKEDRGKLMNICFLMWGAPRFLPYALMFYPDMLPSPFAPLPDGSVKESGLEKSSRERSHAVLETLLCMEKDAKTVPSLAKLNIFGKKAQKKRMESMERMGSLTAKILCTPNVRGPFGAQRFMNDLDAYFYRDSEFSRAENRLCDVPKSLVKGAAAIVEGPGPLTSFIPNFMNRGKVITHIKKISDCDEFLVSESIDLASLDSTSLMEACNERLLGGPGRNDEELRDCLSEWLKLSVVQPATKLQQGQKYFNGNLQKFSLLCYNALDATRDERSASYLPRTLFQGQIRQDANKFIEDVDKNKKNRN